MQYAIYPLKIMRETQAIGGWFSHKGTYALDEGGRNTGVDNLYAPCDLKVVAKGSSAYNAVYYQSINKVRFGNGIEDYINFRTMHDNDISNIYVGKIFKQFDIIGQEGKRGASGNHTHLQVARGIYRGIYKNAYGLYMLVNEIAPNKVFSLLKGYNTVLKTSASWNWVNKSTYEITKPTITTAKNIVYVVKKGDTLSAIANKYKTTYQKIAKDNGIKNPNKISIGQVIVIKK